MARRALLDLPVIAMVLALARGAAAADNECTDAAKPVPGPSRSAAVDAKARNRELYGAVAGLERNVLPYLVPGEKREDAQGVVYWGYGALYGAAMVPGRIPEIGCGYKLQAVDFHRVGLGFGLRYQRVALFYNAAATNSHTASNLTGRAIAGTYTSLMTTGGALVPILSGDDDESLSGFGALRVDAIAGAQLDAGYATLSAGATFSGGLYSNITQRQLHLFAAAALNEALANLPYFRAGLDRLPSLAGGSSAFVRKLQQAPPSAGAAAPAPGAAVDYWTAHVAQHDLQDLVDVEGSLGFVPRTFFDAALISIHTPGYNPRYPGEKSGSRAHGVGARLRAGAVNVRQQAYYSVEGGIVPSIGLDAKLPNGDESDGDYFALGLHFNDPDVLTQFPTAVNAFQVWLSFSHEVP